VVRDGTIRQNLNFPRAVIRWARGYKLDGRRLLSGDPLEGVRLPQEKNVRRPVASHDRYEATLAACPAVDPSSRLACMLALARHTGRRPNAICQLRGSDVYLSPEAVRRVLAEAGFDERQADHMPHGAIRWRAEHDKLGYEDIAPLASAARAALEGYLRASPRIGDAPLFPSRGDPTRPLTKMDASYLLRRAEERAGLLKLERGVWHPYRRLWAVERKHLPDVDVAWAGGWRDLVTMKRSYQRATR
jgi:integrase